MSKKRQDFIGEQGSEKAPLPGSDRKDASKEFGVVSEWVRPKLAELSTRLDSAKEYL